MIERVPHARLLRPPLAIATAPEATPTAPLCKLFAGFDQQLAHLWQRQSVAA